VASHVLDPVTNAHTFSDHSLFGRPLGVWMVGWMDKCLEVRMDGWSEFYRYLTNEPVMF